MTVEIVLLPDPFTMDWQGWADTVAGYNPGLLNEVDPDAEWRDFAERFCEAVPQAPMPDLFEDWRSWASSLKLSLAV